MRHSLSGTSPNFVSNSRVVLMMKPEKWVVSKVKSLQAGGGVEGGCVEAQSVLERECQLQFKKKKHLKYIEKT